VGGRDSDLNRWLEEVRAEYWDGLEAPHEEPEAGRLHLVFDVADRRFAVEASGCRGVVRRPRATRLPGVPPHVVGIVGVRGEVLSVVDLKGFLALPGNRSPGPGYLVILEAEGVRASFWVDRIADVVPLPSAEVHPVEEAWPGAPEGVVKGEWGNAPPVFVLDVAGLVLGSAVREPPDPGGRE